MASSPLRAAAGQQQSRLLDMQKKFQQKHLATVGAVKNGAAGAGAASVDRGDQPVAPVRRFGGQLQQQQQQQRRSGGSGDGDPLVQVDVKGKRPTGRVSGKTAAVAKKPLATVNGNNGGGGGKAAAVTNGKQNLLLPPVVQPTVINALAAGAGAASAVATVNAAAAAAGPGVQRTVVRPAAGKLPPAHHKPAAAPRRRIAQTPAAPPRSPPGKAAASRRPAPKPAATTIRQPSADRGPPAAGMARCPLCARDFAADRLPKHETVCRNTRDRDRKRKVFDTSKKRLESVAAEAGVDVASLKKKTEKEDQRAAEKLQKKKDAWRRKHDALVRNVRAARAVQRHLAAGGSMRDLPPELDAAGAEADDGADSDLVRCPHCKRTFNEASAERHIPQCAERQRHAAARMQNKKR